MRKPLILLALLAVLASACGGDRGDAGDLSGSMSVDGSSTVFPISEAIAEEFMIANPGTQVRVGLSGTGGGFERFCNGETDVSNASRPINEEERQACQAKGIDPIELEVAIDGLTVAVNPDNDFVECLTTGELQNMWRPDSTVETWQDVRPDWPDRRISFFSPGADSGTFDFFTEEIVGTEDAMRTGPDVQTSEDDNILIQGIAGNRDAIGYFGFAYFAENTDKLKAVAIDAGEGCVEPTEDTIESGTYQPLARPLYIYVASSSLEQPVVAAFVEFYIENVNDLVRDVGYIPVPEEALEDARRKLEEATAA